MFDKTIQLEITIKASEYKTKEIKEKIYEFLKEIEDVVVFDMEVK